MTDAPQQFTAVQIAEALGKSARVVRRWLCVIKPDGEMIVRGNVTSAWRIESLPAFVQQELNTTAKARGFTSVAELLSGKIETYRPAVPWNELCEEQQSQAIKLQRALLPALEHWRETRVALGYNWRDDANLVATGVRAYEKEFGAKVSAEHWQNIFDRTLERDNGAGHFHRPELFLCGHPKRRTVSDPVQHPEEFSQLHDLIFNKCAVPTSPSSTERARIWQCAFESLQALSGRELKTKRLHLLKYLWSAAPFLAASQNALRVTLDRMMARGTEAGGRIESFCDGREERRGIATAQPYDKEQIDLIKITAANYTGGSRATAARELNVQGLITDPRIKRSLDTATSKSYLPASLRNQLKDVPAWQVLNLGNSAAQKLVPPMKLSYDGIPSMLCLVPDDHTPDVYVAVPDGKGWFDVMRPQLILIADFRSHRIVGRAIVPAPFFTALDVLAPFKRVFMKYGTPRFILREGGKIFRGSKLVNSLAEIGKRQRNTGAFVRQPFSAAEVEYGLQRSGTVLCSSADEIATRLGSAGVEFREAYQARSKPVEGVIRLFTKEVQKLPCYCGNDERLNCPEETKKAVQLVRNKKASPACPVQDPKGQVEMMTWNQWVETVDVVIAKYNASVQEGRKLRNPLTGAPMSPDEAFEVFTDRDDPPNGTFAPESAMYMSTMQIEVEVKRPNIRRRNFNCGFVELMGNTYCDEQTGARVGEKLLAFYDPETPEVCTFTDLSQRNPFTVARLESPNALFIDEQTKISRSQAQRAISGIRASYKAAEAKFTPVIRQALVAPLVKGLNDHLKNETAVVKEKQRKKTERAATIARDAKRAGMPPGLVQNTERSKSALEGIVEAKRLRELEKQQEKTI